MPKKKTSPRSGLREGYSPKTVGHNIRVLRGQKKDVSRAFQIAARARRKAKKR
jgi:hypothetical protein